MHAIGHDPEVLPREEGVGVFALVGIHVVHNDRPDLRTDGQIARDHQAWNIGNQVS